MKKYLTNNSPTTQTLIGSTSVVDTTLRGVC